MNHIQDQDPHHWNTYEPNPAESEAPEPDEEEERVHYNCGCSLEKPNPSPNSNFCLPCYNALWRHKLKPTTQELTLDQTEATCQIIDEAEDKYWNEDVEWYPKNDNT